MNRIFKFLFNITLVMLLLVPSGYGQIRVPKLISNGMILPFNGQ
jgi:hypothetical protein